MTQENLSLVYVDIEQLAPNPWNTNRITDPANEEKLRESLKRLGAFKPITVRTLPNGGLEILGGEHRWKAAKQLGWKKVPVINVGAVDEKRAKEIGLVDNGRYGEDDSVAFATLLRELGNDVLSIMPFAEADLAALAAVASVDLDDLDKVGNEQLPNLNDLKPAASTQVMRFKVPIGDVAWLTTLVEQEMKRHGFKDEDALSNAGNAFVSLMKRAEKVT